MSTWRFHPRSLLVPNPTLHLLFIERKASQQAQEEILFYVSALITEIMGTVPGFGSSTIFLPCPAVCRFVDFQDGDNLGGIIPPSNLWLAGDGWWRAWLSSPKRLCHRTQQEKRRKLRHKVRVLRIRGFLKTLYFPRREWTRWNFIMKNLPR